jgi:hypothetical protein
MAQRGQFEFGMAIIKQSDGKCLDGLWHEKAMIADEGTIRFTIHSHDDMLNRVALTRRFS